MAGSITATPTVGTAATTEGIIVAAMMDVAIVIVTADVTIVAAGTIVALMRVMPAGNASGATGRISLITAATDIARRHAAIATIVRTRVTWFSPLLRQAS